MAGDTEDSADGIFEMMLPLDGILTAAGAVSILSVQLQKLLSRLEDRSSADKGARGEKRSRRSGWEIAPHGGGEGDARRKQSCSAHIVVQCLESS